MAGEPPPVSSSRRPWQKACLAVALALHAALGFGAYVVVAIGTYGGDEGGGWVQDASAVLAVLLWLAGFVAVDRVWRHWAWAAALLPVPWIVGVLLVASIGRG